MARDVRLGRVSAVLGRGTLLVQAPGPLPVHLAGMPRRDGPRVTIGAHVTDARQNPVGRVRDVIGPVNAPYVVVSPSRGARLHRLPGQDVFAKEGQPGRTRRPHDGRGRRR